MDDFFNQFPDGINVNWSKISDKELDQMVSTLSKQDVEKIFGELRTAIEISNKRKAIVNITLQVLQVAVKLGMKVV